MKVINKNKNVKTINEMRKAIEDLVKRIKINVDILSKKKLF